jgi:adenosylcobinamide-GDP ribazoletransferase
MLAAVRFLTILPIPGRWGAGVDELAGSVPWFPLVGLALGAVAAGAGWVTAAAAVPPLVAAAGLVVLLAAFSGCLHLDGLSDTADGLLSSRPREAMLEIMKDSRTGAMGVAAIVGVALVKFAALASLALRVSPDATEVWLAAVFLMPLAGRSALVVHMAILPCVRADGLAAVFYRRRAPCGAWSRLAAVWAAAVLAAAAWALLGGRGLVVWIAWLAAALLLAGYVYRKLGGATGDTLGAACELLETVPALTLAVWPIQAGR